MKKYFTIFKSVAALLLCVTLCLGLLPAMAAEVSDNLIGTKGNMESTSITLGDTNGKSYVYITTNDGDTKVAFKTATQVPPTLATEAGTENRVLAMGYGEGDAQATSGSSFLEQTTVTAPYQVWEVDVKLPDVTGTAGLFYYGTHATDWQINSSDVTSVMIKGDEVYLVSGTNTTNQTYNDKLALKDDKKLEANKWYKFVRVMDLSSEPDMQKVFVYEKDSTTGSYTLIGKTDGWKLATKENSGSKTNAVKGKGFYVKGYSGSVLFDNLGVYKSEYKLDDISLDGGGNTVAVLDATTSTAITLAARANWLYSLEHDYSIRLKMPEITAGSEIKLFSMGSETYLFTNSTYTDDDIRYNARLDLNRSVIVIEDGKVYSNTYIDSTVSKTAIKDTNGNDLVLEANKWYTFDIHGYLGAHSKSGTTYVSAEDAGKYTISVKEGTQEIATANIVKETYAAKGVGQYYPMSLISAKGFAKPIYFDDIKAETGYTTTAAYDIPGVNTNFENNNPGAALGDILTSSDFGRTYKIKGANFTSSNAYLASDFAGTYLDGTVTSTTLEPLKLKFSGAIDEATFNKNTVVFKANGEALDEEYSLSYDEATLTGTVTFNEKLEYETTYTLEILPTILSKTYGLPLVTGASYSFTTPEDRFTIDNVKFQKKSGDSFADVADVTANHQVGDKIRANVSMTNTSLDPRDYLVICAVFSKNNKMLDIKVNNSKINPGQTLTGETAVVTDAVTVTEADARVEIYIWDNWTQLKPLVVKSVMPEE